MKLATIDAHGSTDCGLRMLKRLNLSDAVKVTLIRRDMAYEGGVVDFTINFSDGDEITVMNAFGMGYGGTGPTGAFDVLTQLGISEDEANNVFYFHGQQLIFKVK